MADTPNPAPSDISEAIDELASERLALLAMFELRGPPTPPTIPGLDLPEARRPERPLLQHPGSFDLALERGPNDGGAHNRRFLGYVCRDAVAIFRGEELGRHEIVLRYCERHIGRWPPQLHQDQRQQVRGWLAAGNLIHFAMRVGQVEQVVGEDGEPRWRLLSPDPVYVIEGRPERAVQVRGLPPAEQERRYALERRRVVREFQAALVSADKTVAKDIGDVLSADPAAVITAELVGRGGLPEAFVGEPIVAARPTLQRWHRDNDMPIASIKRWVAHWRDLAQAARMTPRVLVPAAPPAQIPDSDADALGTLAW